MRKGGHDVLTIGENTKSKILKTRLDAGGEVRKGTKYGNGMTFKVFSDSTYEWDNMVSLNFKECDTYKHEVMAHERRITLIPSLPYRISDEYHLTTWWESSFLQGSVWISTLKVWSLGTQSKVSSCISECT